MQLSVRVVEGHVARDPAAEAPAAFVLPGASETLDRLFGGVGTHKTKPLLTLLGF